jgi:hypothetical protein
MRLCEGSGFRVQGFRGSGLRVQGFWVQGFWVQGSKVLGSAPPPAKNVRSNRKRNSEKKRISNDEGRNSFYFIC